MDTSFENALAKFQASLTERQRRDFAPCTLEDVQTAIDEIQVRLGSQRRLKGMKMIAKFIEAMTQLAEAIAVCLNIGNAIAFVWVSAKLPCGQYNSFLVLTGVQGPIRFVLLVSSLSDIQITH